MDQSVIGSQAKNQREKRSCLHNAASDMLKLGKEWPLVRCQEKETRAYWTIPRHSNSTYFFFNVHWIHACWCQPCACRVPRFERFNVLFPVRTVQETHTYICVSMYIHTHAHTHSMKDYHKIWQVLQLRHRYGLTALQEIGEGFRRINILNRF